MLSFPPESDNGADLTKQTVFARRSLVVPGYSLDIAVTVQDAQSTEGSMSNFWPARNEGGAQYERMESLIGDVEGSRCIAILLFASCHAPVANIICVATNAAKKAREKRLVPPNRLRYSRQEREGADDAGVIRQMG